MPGQGGDHAPNQSTIGRGPEDMRQASAVMLVAGRARLAAAKGFPSSGIASGLIVDEDTALELATARPE